MVIWLIGLSGSGKTTIGRELTKRLKSVGRPAIFMDGDIFRSIMGDDVGHTIEDRKINADRICRFCHYLDKEGLDVVFAVLSLFHEAQDWIRNNVNEYFEIFFDVSMDTVCRRDPKGLYKKALAGELKNMVGVDIPFPPPKNPDMIIKNDEDLDDFDPKISLIFDSLPMRSFL